MKFYQHFRLPKYQVNYLLQKIKKKFEKEEYYFPRRKITCGVASNLSTISALQVNVISLKIAFEATEKQWLLQDLKITEYSLHIKVIRALLTICSHIGRCRRTQLRWFWRPSRSRICNTNAVSFLSQVHLDSRKNFLMNAWSWIVGGFACISLLLSNKYRVRIKIIWGLCKTIFSQVLNRNTWCYYHLKEECLQFHSDLKCIRCAPNVWHGRCPGDTPIPAFWRE